MKRRQFLAALSTILLTPAFLSSCASSGSGASGASGASEETQLNILNWADYLHPGAIGEFEKRYSCKVVYDTFASNEALMAKLQAGGNLYDVIVPSSYMVKQLNKMGVLSELEHDRLPGLNNLMPRFKASAFDPGLKHCVPYTWGTTGIGFDGKKLQALGIVSDADSPNLNLAWDVFWNDKLAKRMTLLDDGREVIGMALKRAGHSYNTQDPALIKAATADLIKQKPLTMCYTSDQVIVELASGDSYLSQVFSGDAYQAKRDNPDLRYVIPSDGASIWTDNFCIPVTAPHKDLAYKWINYMLEPAVAAACANFTNYAIANQSAWKLVNPVLRNDQNLYPPESVISRCEELGDLGEAIFLYDRMWTELKCAD